MKRLIVTLVLVPIVLAIVVSIPSRASAVLLIVVVECAPTDANPTVMLVTAVSATPGAPVVTVGTRCSDGVATLRRAGFTIVGAPHGADRIFYTFEKP